MEIIVLVYIYCSNFRCPATVVQQYGSMAECNLVKETLPKDGRYKHSFCTIVKEPK